MTSSDDYAAMVRSLTASTQGRAAAKRPGPPQALGAAVWVMVLVIGAICLAVHLASPTPVPHRAAPARCTVSAPCYTGHHGGHLIGAYVLVRTARGIVRMPLHAARIWYRLRMLRGPRVRWNLPGSGSR